MMASDETLRFAVFQYLGHHRLTEIKFSGLGRELDPLKYDEDAFRLMAAAKVSVEFDLNWRIVSARVGNTRIRQHQTVHVDYPDDLSGQEAAVRRAITTAVANEILRRGE